MLEKNQAYKSHLRNNKSLQFLNQFWFLQTKLNSSIEESNKKHHISSYKVVRSSEQPELLLLVNIKNPLNNKKFYCIPPLIH